MSRPRYAPILNSGEARRAALVARFAAGRTLPIRRSSLFARLLLLLQIPFMATPSRSATSKG